MSDVAVPRQIAAYDAAAMERRVDEAPKHSARSAFARDRARVLHSFALRRLGAKTQVVGPTDVESDFPRTRLTHSLECAQIGRDLGAALGCDPDIVETACLAHDLGHPPFGHNGESALAQIARHIGGFEGNAQSFRLLTRLEAKILDAAGHSVGLNLTRASLDAATKYPWGPDTSDADAASHSDAGAASVPDAGVSPPGGVASVPDAGAASGGASGRKFGAYREDLAVLDWVRAGAPARRPCLEAQVMDWADDVAYSVHDLEDGIHAELVPLRRLRNPAGWADVVDVAAERYLIGVERAEIDDAVRRLLSFPWWLTEYTGSRRELAALKNMTSELIGRFCSAAETATRQAYGAAPVNRYAAELVVPREARIECGLLKAVTAHFVMARHGAEETRVRQREVLADLVEALVALDGTVLDPVFAEEWREAADDAGRLRAVVDQVAALTDTSALAWHRRLCPRNAVVIAGTTG
ncbi:putative deoxyguanosinetriphosphate triphosphohydrolase [Acidothermus cellulolyticus 11B]|uniref:Deoxyguanosinetriphosphate triphosphohydrolase-like protein n=1 Tax=Acidothermus cellulolyticus (strain ATCC 43068 / DSM 8971 / 11B) TaxID=351607 RepID=A0LT15_ACIC1|nr:putative deoxyguanosinetriphosphate triphosphohydrolase [Acidothermus cellulolyticus 11B]